MLMKIFRYATRPERLIIWEETNHDLPSLTVPLDPVLACGVMALALERWPAVLQALDRVLRAAVEAQHQHSRATLPRPDPARQLGWLEDTLTPSLLNGPADPPRLPGQVPYEAFAR